MKKTALIILSVMLTICCCACSSTEVATSQEVTEEATAAETEAPTETSVPVEIDVMDPVPAVEFTALLTEVSAQHKAMVESDAILDSIDQYLVVDPETVNLLTEEEIQEVMKQAPIPMSLTYDEAVYDMDVLFRAFRSSYGAYYYFGEEAFQKAQEEIMHWLNGKTTVFTNELEQAMSEAFSFLRDAHGTVGHRFYEEDIRYEYFYTDQAYAQDDDGYYLYLNGEKWYVEFYTDSRVKMEPALTADGEIVYSPILFCTVGEKEFSSVILKNAAGQTKELPINWTQSQAYGPAYRTPDFKLLEENGIAYLSVRCFDYQYQNGDLAQFVASGKELKDARLIIFDIRANGGGTDSFCREWMQHFCGTIPQYNMVHTTRISHLRNTYLENQGFHKDQGTPGTYRQRTEKGKQIKNQIPIIVLVDDTCGSAGEGMLNFLQCLDNVIIVGSNSAGYQMCGNQTSMWLPHSNIPFVFGSSLQFHFTDENVDFKGYEPDIWCNPLDALDCVLNMLLRYELTDSATWQSLSANPLLQKPLNLTIRWQSFEILPGNNFGSIMDSGKEFIKVYNSTERITDFTVQSEAPELLEVGVAADGQLYLNRLNPFEGIPVGFTITYQGKNVTYYCLDSTYIPE